MAVGSASPMTNPTLIKKLAAKAYVWGLAPEFVYRFERYNDLVTAPRNTFGGVSTAAAWNNNATNAGDASVLYLNAMVDLSGQKGRGGTKELVLTVPPSNSNYYVVNLLDDFINTVGSIGTRTTPSARAQTYLIVGPTSRYAHKRSVQIHGFTYRVMPYDTNLGWILIRVRADTLVPASDPASAATIVKNVDERFAMSTLAQFEARRHRPNYFNPGQYTPTAHQKKRAAKWHSAPTNAVAFFKQIGASLRLNPLPDATTGLNGIPLSTLPSWIAPQAGATRRYRNPSYLQGATLAQFKPLGLTANNFTVPGNWGPKQIKALQAGFEAGQQKITGLVTSAAVSQETNFWNYLNHSIGTYPNTPQGYQYRAVIVVSGGSANVPLDGVYAQLNNLDGTSATTLDGNSTYTLTFTPPMTSPATLPVVGSLPPTVNDSQGNPRGFWSIHAYQTDTTESAAPFITQASVLNTAYSTANLKVTGVNPSTDTITVQPSTWGPLVASSPILFGPTASSYGLKPDVPYYVATTPAQQTNPTTKATTYSFKISTHWLQQLSSANVPIQGNTGKPGPDVQLMNPGGPVNLQWGPIQPVSQLGSQQLTSGELAKNANGSVTIWIGPTLPPGAPATNWLPTPSTAYYATLYPGVNVPTQIRLMMRIYYPAPGSDTQASILPPPNGSMAATYVFPALQNTG
ncbi:MAG: hypothetical protein QOE30_1071 [Mycobacterium sp.]|uniref:DUF1254 domain-containing protein n=1 Tax=Mycobacterium sp. TaxID=1785 RepID=UPI0028B9C709|nr:DUF1254 domain-containing protein [Mycobacterium sp.]MDT5115332.1 hypothetical protein [Mycobacterium sp.]